MMKQLAAFILTLSMVLGLLALPAGASVREERNEQAYVPAAEREVPYSLLERAVGSTQPETGFTPAPEKRGEVYYYGIPSPMMDDQAVVAGQTMPLRFIFTGNGTGRQYFYCYIYKGNFEAVSDPDYQYDPVYWNESISFPYSPSIHEFSFPWNTKGQTAGTYTIITFTVLDRNQIVEDSAYYAEVQLVEQARPVTGLELYDIETGERVQEINLVCGEERAFTVGRVPSPTTDVEDLAYRSGGSCHVMEEYFGLIYSYGAYPGSTNMAIYVGNTGSSVKLECKVNVCVSEDGHKYRTATLAEATDLKQGVKQHTCVHCGYSYLENMNSRTEAFEAFRDVSQSQWYYPEVQDAVVRGLFNGISDTAFGPESSMTRAMLVTVLWRYAGQPKPEQAAAFSDVSQDVWYANAVAWAAENGIVNGVGQGKFDPDGAVSREMLATILYRYVLKIGEEGQARDDLQGFADAQQVSPWAKEGIQWAVASGILGGSKDGGRLWLLPLDGATRAQVAAILVRMIDKVLTKPVQEQLPEGEILAQGRIRAHSWDLYENGVLVIRQEEDGEEGSWSDHSEDIREIRLLNGVEEIYENEFSAMTALETVRMADSVRHIYAKAFEGCTSLREIELSETLYSIGNLAFYGCSALCELKLPTSIGSIGAEVFRSCTSLKEIVLPDGNIWAEKPYNGATGIFMDCTSLETVYFGKGNRSVRWEMFRGCSALKYVHWNDGILEIQMEAFVDCGALEQITLPKELRFVDVSAFEGCKLLKEVTVLYPYVQLTTPYEDSNYEPYYTAPFVPGCLIRGYEGSTAQNWAVYFGYSFEAIND